MAYENKSRLTNLTYDEDIEPTDIKNSLIVTFSKGNINYIIEELYDNREKQANKYLKQIKDLAREDNITNPKILCNAAKGLAGYYGALLPKEKMFIEKCFEKGLIDTVVGTDALALGVNFPVENVIFAQLSKYYDSPISKNLFEQLAGRAGRKGYFNNGHVYYCSEFGKILEAYGYNTEDLFNELLEAKNEDISIKLTPNIKDILLNKTTIEEDAEFITCFSTEEVSKEGIIKRISSNIKYIKEDSFDIEVERIANERFGYDEEDEYYDEELELHEKEHEDKRLFIKEMLEKKEEFQKNIALVYFPEYSSDLNCKIFSDIICGVESDEILEKYATSDNFYNMLQFRKYVKTLPKQYRKGLTKISDKICEIDSSAIDGFRDRVSIDEIGKDLKKSCKLDGKNIMRILNEHTNFQKMGERINILEEQLKIAEEYGLEEY